MFKVDQWSRFLFGESRKRVLSSLLFYAVLFYLILPAGFRKISGNDLWKALYSGRYLALFQQFPHHSTFTFSPVKEIVLRDSYNWLGNLFFIGCYELSGIPGIQIFRLFVLIFAVLLMHSMLDFKVNPLVLFVLLVMSYAVFQKLLIRTAIFVVPFMVLLFWFWHQIAVRRNTKWFWGIPVLFLFWGSIHGSYLAGFGFLTLLLAGRVIDVCRLPDPDSRLLPEWARALCILLLVVLVVTFVKPFPDYKVLDMPGRLTGGISHVFTGENHPRTMSENPKNSSARESGFLNGHPPVGAGNNSGRKSAGSIFESTYSMMKGILQNTVITSDPRIRSQEFAFPLESYTFIFVTLGFAFFVVGFGMFIVAPADFRWSDFLPFLAAAILGISYLRTVAYLPLVATPIMFMKYQKGDFEDVELGSITFWVTVAVLVLFVVNVSYFMFFRSFGMFVGVMYQFGWGLPPRFSSHVPEYMVKKFPHEEVFNHYNVGSYLVWKWWPYKKVFIDTKGSAYEDSFHLDYVTGAAQNLTDRFELDFVLFPISSMINYSYFIPHPKWTLEAFDQGMVVYRRTEEPGKTPPLRALLLDYNEFMALSEQSGEGISLVVKFLDKYQNRAEKKDPGEKVELPTNSL